MPVVSGRGTPACAPACGKSFFGRTHRCAPTEGVRGNFFQEVPPAFSSLLYAAALAHEEGHGLVSGQVATVANGDVLVGDDAVQGHVGACVGILHQNGILDHRAAADLNAAEEDGILHGLKAAHCLMVVS